MCVLFTSLPSTPTHEPNVHSRTLTAQDVRRRQHGEESSRHDTRTGPPCRWNVRHTMRCTIVFWLFLSGCLLFMHSIPPEHRYMVVPIKKKKPINKQAKKKTNPLLADKDGHCLTTSPKTLPRARDSPRARPVIPRPGRLFTLRLDVTCFWRARSRNARQPSRFFFCHPEAESYTKRKCLSSLNSLLPSKV